jgi:catechol 2,3-dioxygenase-like lactoylglutathione lyase family enzyme
MPPLTAGGTPMFAMLVLVMLLLVMPPAMRDASAQIRDIDSVAITVADMDRSVAFYRDVLTFEKVSDIDVAGEEWGRLEGVAKPRMRVVRLRLGDEALELMEYATPHGRPIPRDARSNDRWFQHVAIVVNDMGRACSRLKKHNVETVSQAPQRLPDWNPEASGIRAFYFKDPDGHPLELLRFPPGKGDPKWQWISERLFLGIDHTAIVVGDSEKSLAFYRDELGLRVAGRSDNYGLEQERLSAVPGAHVRITTLRAPSGPGVELLEYLTPLDGKPFPADARSNDLLHWQIRAVAMSPEGVVERLKSQRSRGASRGVVQMPGAPLGFTRGVLIRDPDGHSVELVD